MKNIQFPFKNSVLIALLPLLLVINSCTKDFEDYNTNGVTDEMLEIDFNSIGAFFPSIQNAFSDGTAIDKGDMQSGGAFTGYFNTANPGGRISNYLMDQVGEFGLFTYGFNGVMSSVNEIKRRGAATSVPDFYGVALILKVAGMKKITDIYGPIPYTQYGKGGNTVSYDSQEVIYNTFFSELDTAVSNLNTYIALNPGAKPFARFDRLYAGDYTRWLKFANSLRLRLAMQIVKVDPAKAKAQAEKAMDPVNGGVFTTNDESAIGGVSAVWVGTHSFGDVRAGAAIITYMRGYNDPRISKYFEISTTIPGEYVGIRSGSVIESKNDYLKFSDVSLTNFTSTTPYEWMTAAEVYFLRAEGALRGWNMGGGSVQELYEEGINTSLIKWGVAGEANTYINNSTGKPANHVDPVTPGNNAEALSTITVKWDEAAGNEKKLERIITQKWIAMFPDCSEGWSNFRRTGYPKLFPVAVNNSGGTVDTQIQIRRMNYPIQEVTNNPAEVQKAIQLLGGPDTGGTRLWWDTNKGNF